MSCSYGVKVRITEILYLKHYGKVVWNIPLRNKDGLDELNTNNNGAPADCKIAHNLDIQMMNSNCFAIYLPWHFSYVC